MIDDRKFDESLRCDVGRRHSGRSKIAHTECLYLAGRMIEDRRFDVNFDCGVSRGHSGRPKIT